MIIIPWQNVLYIIIFTFLFVGLLTFYIRENGILRTYICATCDHGPWNLFPHELSEETEIGEEAGKSSAKEYETRPFYLGQ